MTLERTRFAGTISRNNETFPVDFDVLVGEDQRLILSIEPVSERTCFALAQGFGKPGSSAESLILQGTGSKGETFYSDTIEMRRTNGGSAGAHISVIAQEAKLQFRSNSVERPRMRLWLRGFKSFPTPSVKMSLGAVRVQGPSRLRSADEASGSITVQAIEGTCLDSWIEKADRFLTFMHCGLAFSRGARLQAPRVDILSGDVLEHRFYAGDAFGLGLAPIHHLDQGDFIRALAERFDKTTDFPEILWTVTGWLHSDSLFDEARFLMSMTSIETAVEHMLPEHASSLIPKAQFEPVRDALLVALNAREIEEPAATMLQSKIRQLNSRSLHNKIQSLRDHYELPGTVFTDSKIKEIVITRNKIVHQGRSEGRPAIWPLIVFIRDFLTQVAFREIGYSGRHMRFMDSSELKDVDD